MTVEVTERDLELILNGLKELRNNKAARGQWRLPKEVDRLIDRLTVERLAQSGHKQPPSWSGPRTDGRDVSRE
jgi:hypothetical protein